MKSSKTRKKKPRAIVIGANAAQSLKRAIAISKIPHGSDPLALAVKRIAMRAEAESDENLGLKKRIAEEATGKLRGDQPYVFDVSARTVTRRRTGAIYQLHRAAFEILDALHKRHLKGEPPIRIILLTPDGTRGVHDAFLRPRTGDGCAALREIVIRKGGRISLRIP